MIAPLFSSHIHDGSDKEFESAASAPSQTCRRCLQNPDRAAAYMYVMRGEVGDDLPSYSSLQSPVHAFIDYRILTLS